jgi:hypothetical protein
MSPDGAVTKKSKSFRDHVAVVRYRLVGVAQTNWSAYPGKMKITKIKNLRFDHTFTPDARHGFLRHLETVGFTLQKTTTVHPGGAHCRFISIRHNAKVARQYLEFIHFSGSRKQGYSGLSLAAVEPLKKFAQRMACHKSLKAEYTHRNYEWAKNAKDHLPGWNFLNFKATPQKLFFWLTEYEPWAKRRGRIQPVTHKNLALRIAAVEIDVSRRDERFFKLILGVRHLGTLQLASCPPRI